MVPAVLSGKIQPLQGVVSDDGGGEKVGLVLGFDLLYGTPRMVARIGSCHFQFKLAVVRYVTTERENWK